MDKKQFDFLDMMAFVMFMIVILAFIIAFVRLKIHA